jgi:hypothetical protein
MTHPSPAFGPASFSYLMKLIPLTRPFSTMISLATA